MKQAVCGSSTPQSPSLTGYRGFLARPSHHTTRPSTHDSLSPQGTPRVLNRAKLVALIDEALKIVDLSDEELAELFSG